MNDHFKRHLERIQTALDPRSQVRSAAEWLTKNTTIKGKPFSFVDHEYQKVLLDDPTEVKYCIKCSQVGISEIAVRRVIAKTQLHAGINAMYVLPTAAFASTFSSTRLASALDSAKAAKDSLHKTDSATVKRFFNDSYIYMRGASRSGQAISVPVSDLTMDEVDFAEDQDVLTSFASRLTHAEASVVAQLWFSTPTVGGYGISHLFDNSKQYVEMQRCNHCNHQFIADYYEHVKLPGFNALAVGKKKFSVAVKDRSLLDINFMSKALLTRLDVKTAFLGCPKCHRPVDQSVEYRGFVCVNPDSNFDEHGYRISPFSAPKYMPPPKMIKKSTTYKSVKDFVNNCLGLSHEDSTTGLSKREIDDLFRSDIDYPERPPYQISGTDMGGSCAHFTAFPAPNGHLRIMTAQMIPLNRFEVEYANSLGSHNVISSVIDLMPYTDLVARLQNKFPTLFACLFSKTKGVELYAVRAEEEDEHKASYGVRQVTAKKNALLDFLVGMIRGGQISFAPSTFAEQETIVAHMRDMKRIETSNKDGDVEYVWVKSAAGEDHYMHALAYLVLANFLKGLSTGLAPLPMLLGTFKQKRGL